MAEQSLIPGVDPIIISVKSKSWPLGGRWVGGDIPTSSKWFKLNFPEVLYGQGVLRQKMGSYNLKMAECK